MKNGDRLAFMPIPTSTLAMVTEKDRRFHSASKMAQGIVSYSTALHDLAAFFHAVKTGSARPNSQPVSAWARAWGWDWRKALRFISVVMNDFFERLESLSFSFHQILIIICLHKISYHFSISIFP